MIKVLLSDWPKKLPLYIDSMLNRFLDIEIIGRVNKNENDMYSVLNIFELFINKDPDIIIFTLLDSEEMPSICTHLLSENPEILIMGISHQRTRVCMMRRSVSIEEILDTSDESILMAIRQYKSNIDLS